MVLTTEKKKELRSRADYFTCNQLDDVPEEKAQRIIGKVRKARPDLFKE